MCDNWYKKVNRRTRYIFNAIIDHDFIEELLRGTLDQTIFQFYVTQDSFYLAEYKKVLVALAIKCNNTADTQFFLEAATGILEIEKNLHKTFLKGVKPSYDLSPTCDLYISYLTRMVHNFPPEVGIAAILPCFTIYKEVGDYLLQSQNKKVANPYQNWIGTYGGDAFAQEVKRVVEIANQWALHASENRLKIMEEAFIKASKMEWMFWDSAYQKEQWKL